MKRLLRLVIYFCVGFCLGSAVGLLGIMLSGCGVHVSSDPVRTDNAKIVHEIAPNLEEVKEFFTADCKVKYTNQADIDQCTNLAMANFLNFVMTGQTVPTPTPSPSPSN